MDPFTALIVAGLVTWGTVGSGIKDTAAIARGQAPPSHAYRMAKLEQRNNQLAEQGKKQKVVKPTRYRRITLMDLLTHWWEDGLETADAWRERRHASRPERKAKRKEFIDGKKALVKKGYGLLKERGQARFADRKHNEPETGDEPQEQPQSRGQEQDLLPEGDNVVPLRPHRTDTTDTTEETLPMELQLADKNTYAGHKDGLIKYQAYFTQVADRIEQINARAHEQEMSQNTVGKGATAMEACSAVAAKASACARSLEQAHQSVAEQRAATGNRSDADYLTTS